MACKCLTIESCCCNTEYYWNIQIMYSMQFGIVSFIIIYDISQVFIMWVRYRRLLQRGHFWIRYHMGRYNGKPQMRTLTQLVLLMHASALSYSLALANCISLLNLFSSIVLRNIYYFDGSTLYQYLLLQNIIINVYQYNLYKKIKCKLHVVLIY